jgi:hypothetical protein
MGVRELPPQQTRRKKERRDGSRHGHEGLGPLPLEGKRRADGGAEIGEVEKGRDGVQTGSAISRDRSSLLIALLRRRSDTRA